MADPIPSALFGLRLDLRVLVQCQELGRLHIINDLHRIQISGQFGEVESDHFAFLAARHAHVNCTIPRRRQRSEVSPIERGRGEPIKGAQSRVHSVRDYPVRFSCVRSSLL